MRPEWAKIPTAVGVTHAAGLTVTSKHDMLLLFF